MGGRGASSGISKSGKKYGTEYDTLLTRGKIKFVRNESGSASSPMETRSKRRIYVTINKKDNIKAITFYDKKLKRSRQIDVSGNKHYVDGKRIIPHVHKGYLHNENGDRDLSINERKLLVRVKRIWDNRGK
ncbi:hypothetical protein WA04_00720 [Streptococcus agalactiae]|uniref:Uncharacterized protein n=1 Tax=Streptococcus agalactiae TaxID=1311 RepID=A0A837L1L6_STRAG|nr:hypothetical protein [Streptococcus agalactiae]KLL45478.1 hypothetical protein WA04_00720 [Streptococcus agalactiae]HEN5913937.1 hypothetical protein [Streptococcus agalactiae]